MTLVIKTSVVVLLIATLVSCGGGNVSVREPRVAPESTSKPCDESAAKVVPTMFADRGCTPCIRELPVLAQRMKEEFKDKTCRIKPVVYMTDRELTQEQADEWVRLLNLAIPFEARLDLQCKTEYKKYWKGCVKPAGVIFSEKDGNIIKYKVGEANLKVDVIVADIRSELERTQ